MVAKSEISIGEKLISAGIIKKDALDRAMSEHERTNAPLVQCLSKLKLAKEDKMLDVLSKELYLPFIKLRDVTIDKSLIQKIPVRFVAHYKFMPVKLTLKPDGLNYLSVAVASPLNIMILDELRLQLGYEIEVMLTVSDELMGAMKKYYGLAADTMEKIMSTTGKDEMIIPTDMSLEKVEDIEKLAEDASIIKLVNQILLEAHRSRATDIHLEPYRGKIRLRYRIDGILYNINVPTAIKNFYLSILSRIKIMSNLNIVERRLPQDGRAVVKTEKETLDMRISIIPTPYGESAVIRLLPTKMLYNLSDLGLTPEELSILQMLLNKPHGIIFVTGPTGSGKTTTLYASLHKLNTHETKILTIEDPIEYEMEGITQIQVMPEIDLTFARALRSMLRHDPDVMMVGEVRDFETAEITIRIALTGHLIFSTIHTNDAAGGVTRLIDMGVEPYLIASSVEAFIAQRLVRVICPECKENDTLTPKVMINQMKKELGTDDITPYRGKGCDECNFTGYQGRTAIYEIMLIDENVRKLVLAKSSSDEIKKAAIRNKMKTLRIAGWEKVRAGITTVEEVLRVSPGDPPEILAAANLGFKNEATFEMPLAETPRGGRVYNRLSVRIPMEFALHKTSVTAEEESFPKYIKTVAQDISPTGIQWLAAETVLPGSIVKLKIYPPNLPMIECLVKVVRIEEAKETVKPGSQAKYNIGSYYLDIESSDKAKLIALTESA
ncbi:MAG: ATPase, T2SS/T4P/T4SS family [Candidatus Brocadiia bacterium]